MGKRGGPIGHPPYSGCETGGRPKVYTDKKLEDLADSLNTWIDEAIKAKNNFLLADWAFENKFLPQNFIRYAPQNAKFNEAYMRAKAWQEHMISKGALLGKLNPRFAQFMLGCNHDWKMKEVVEHQGNETINVVHYGTKEPRKWDSGIPETKNQNTDHDKKRERNCSESKDKKEIRSKK